MKTAKHMKSVLFTQIMILYVFNVAIAQVNVSGVVIEKNGDPVIGANIFIQGSYDGSMTDENGNFEFKTNTEGTQILEITYLGYETKTITNRVDQFKNLTITIRESAMSLDAVEITASTFKAGDNSKLAVLKPLDIVTTAGSMGDVIASLQTLPGTSANAEDGRLFIRGGDARESQIFIDGLKVFTPYSRTVSGTPSRGRYSPFLFKGVSFSTGGYEAEFGQALSGILDMNTIDEAIETKTDLSLMTVGLGVGHTQKIGNQSISLSASYTDLTPYFWLVNSRLGLKSPFRGFSGEGIYRNKTKNGLFKFYVAGERQTIEVRQFDLDAQQDQEIGIRNSNYYFNTNYTSILDDKTSIYTGISFGVNNDKTGVDEFNINTDLIGTHGKVAFKTLINDHFVLNYGADVIYQKDGIATSTDNNDFHFNDKISRTITGSFIETDYFFTKNSAIKIGLRGENNNLIGNYELSPRITMAQKIGQKGQLSFAYGQFRQEVDKDYLFDENNKFENEKATHYLVNYNYKTDKQMLRLEGYYKKYDHLLKYDNSTEFNNEGNGYAYGADVFWRANKMIKYVDCWVSYSYLISRRNYLNYPVEATTPFSTRHNLSVVGKRWFENLKSSVSFTYSFTSGRPYENPNTAGFMNERSKSFHNMSASWAYLISQQKILFFSVSNFPGFKNEYGYRYASAPGMDGIYPSELIRPNEDRFFFVGFFITMSKDKTKNQLDNLQ